MIMDTSSDTSPLDYRCQVVAGYNWSPSKYIFSSDDRHFLIPSGSTVRVYSVADGSFVHSLPFEEDDSLILQGDNIASIQLYPYLPKKYVICFTNNRKLVIISLETGKVVHHEDLFKTINLPPQELGQGMDFGHCMLMKTKKGKKCELFFGVMSHFRFYQRELPYPFTSSTTQPKHFHLVPKEKMKKQNIHQSAAVAISPSNRFFAMINGRFLYVHGLPVDSSKAVMHMQMDNEFTCIASHPQEEVLATGDSIGSVTIWRNFVGHTKTHRSTYHWHPSPVTCMSFSSVGSKLYSACAQGKLISWQMDNPGVHSVVSKMNVPIRGVLADSSNKHIALSLMDGSIQLTASNSSGKKNTVTLLENSVSQIDVNSNLSEAILDGSSKCILIRGFNGALQFFSLSSNSVEQVIDVTETNYYQNYGDGARVTLFTLNNIAISLDGNWLATDELREDPDYLMEERLRFWTKQDGTYQLVNLVDLPHDKAITQMKFSYDASILVTISNDCNFKVWKRIPNGTKNNCVFVLWQTGNRSLGLPPVYFAISCDSSIVAVQFENLITFWDVTQKTTNLIEDLHRVNCKWEEPLIGFDFAAGSLIHLFTQVRRNTIETYNFMTAKQHWTIENEPNITNCAFAFNHSTNRMAILNSEKCITIYDVNCQVPLGYVSNEVTNTIGDIRSLLVVDLSTFMTSNHQTQCQAPAGILCVNSKKQLVSLLPRNFKVERRPDHQSEDEEENVSNNDGTFKIVGQLIQNINALPLERKASQAKRKIEMDFNSDQLVNDMFIKDATHLIPSVNLLCQQFLKSLFLKDVIGKSDKKAKSERV